MSHIQPTPGLSITELACQQACSIVALQDTTCFAYVYFPYGGPNVPNALCKLKTSIGLTKFTVEAGIVTSVGLIGGCGTWTENLPNRLFYLLLWMPSLLLVFRMVDYVSWMNAFKVIIITQWRVNFANRRWFRWTRKTKGNHMPSILQLGLISARFGEAAKDDGGTASASAWGDSLVVDEPWRNWTYHWLQRQRPIPLRENVAPCAA
ncbi:hypothetical protein DFH08DRAFT_812246 [Mycena albidolilacea]|uniref:Uncharacterized protein n=1 Tax=Mycena albidolilacea TaxID=1033008 RepID=A0AAD7ENN7_9AGAR|nr:hypothetical protein DFH08DRAFT_812246 [Mycena albidolilacea]